VHAAAAQVIDDAAGRTLVADVKGSVDGNGANIVSNSSAAEQQQQQQQQQRRQWLLASCSCCASKAQHARTRTSGYIDPGSHGHAPVCNACSWQLCGLLGSCLHGSCLLGS
jgi:hypothetical protein